MNCLLSSLLVRLLPVLLLLFVQQFHTSVSFPIIPVVGTTAEVFKNKIYSSLSVIPRGGAITKLVSPLKMSSSSSSTSASVVSTTSTANTSKNKKLRIVAFDSIRVFLIIGIVFGHFFSFAQSSSKVLNTFFSQHNVLVGAFFALSGYVTAYTTTDNNSYEVSSKVLTTPKQLYILQRIFGYIVLHWIVLLLFSPMFIYIDMYYNSIQTTIINFVMSLTLTQAYFPNKGAEVWNAPTWFLSSLTLANIIIPYCIQPITKLNKKQLTQTGFWVYVIGYLLPKLGYCYDYNTWYIPEGITSPKLIPNLSAFNIQRFLPFFAIAEVLLGIIACRIVMLDKNNNSDASTNKKDDDVVVGTVTSTKPKTNYLSTSIPLLGMIGFLYARSLSIPMLSMSDLLARSVIFVPLFLRFLMACHRNTVVAANAAGAATTGSSSSTKDPILLVLQSKLLVSIGTIVFPIFIVHGPIGQIFFKKLIATKLFGTVLTGPYYFTLYIITTFVSAYILQKGIVENKTIQSISNTIVSKLSKLF